MVTDRSKEQLLSLFKRSDREAFLKLLYDKYEEPMNGGFADGKHPREFDPKQLLMGIKVEFEHGKQDVIRATKISMDHLMELPASYYTRLDAMEEEAKKEGEKPFNNEEEIIDEIKKSFVKE